MDEIAKKLAELAEKYGPHTIESVRGAAIIEAWSNLQGAILCGAFTIGACFVAKRLWQQPYQRGSLDAIEASWGQIFAVVLLVIATIAGLIAITSITDPWLWVTFNNPDLWIAKRVFKL